MGSKNCAETPRQKMIGMMYLFLTAMLALNVSSEVLNGFTKVDESLRSSAENFEKRNNAIYDDFKSKYSINPTKVEHWQEAARKVGVLSDSMFQQIENYKFDIVRDVDGPTGNPDSIGAKDNLDGPSRVMLTGGKNSKGVMLKDGINNFRKDLLDIMTEAVKFNDASVDSSIVASLNESLSTPVQRGKDGEQKDWEVAYFSEMPTAASIALLSKLQNNVRDAESQVIQFLLKQIDAKDFKVNKIEAHIIPKSTSIIRGGTFSAQMLLAGRDTTNKPEYFINGQKLSANSEGVYTRLCDETGNFTISGEIVRRDQDGNIIRHELEPISYEVIDPFATVSATKMNVLYAGVENPVSISVPGVAASDIRPTTTNGSLRSASNGQGYIAIPRDINSDAIIKVNAIIDGEERSIANYPFRVKLLPDPLPFIYYEEPTVGDDGKIKTVPQTTNKSNIEFRLLKYFKAIRAELPGSDFEVDYDVLSFRILMIHKNGNNLAVPTEGAQFTTETSNFLKEFRGTLTITEVKAKGPDGITRNLPPIVMTVE